MVMLGPGRNTPRRYGPADQKRSDAENTIHLLLHFSMWGTEMSGPYCGVLPCARS